MFINVTVQVVILFILILVGVVLAKAKILNEAACKGMTDVVLNIATPCVIIKSFIREFDKASLKTLLLSFIIAIVSHLFFIIISHLLIKDNDKAREKVLRFGIVFANCGYMSLPLQQALLGDEGVFIASAYVAIFNVFMWSYGLALMGGKENINAKKVVLNPGIIAVSIGMVIFLLSIPVPSIISEPIGYFAGLNTPLPMIIIGYYLTKSDIFKTFKNLKCIWAMVLRLIILPLAAVVILRLCNVTGTMLISSAISICSPMAAATTMFSARFGADTEASANLVSVSTLVSIITMPLIVTLAQYIS